MKHRKNYFIKSLCYLTIVLLLTTCNKEETSIKDNWTIVEIDPLKEVSLEEKVNSIFSSPNGRKATQNGIVWDKAIKIVDPRNGKARYTFRYTSDSLNQFSNFILTETKTGLTGFIIIYEPANDWYKNGSDFAKFTGKLLSLDLNGIVTGMSLVKDGRTVKALSGKGGRTNDLPPFPESPGCYELVLSTATGSYFWAQRACGGGGGSSSETGSSSNGGSTSGGSGSGSTGGNDSNYGNNNSGGGTYGGGTNGTGGEEFGDTPIGVYYDWPGSDLGYPKNWWLDDQWLDENFQIDPYDQFKKLTQAEKDLVKQFPQEALKIKKNRDVATQKTISQFNENGHNNKSDAFRHAYFQGLNTYSVGAQLTKLFADAHESETPISLNLEKQMDLHNNEKGIDYGSNCPCDIELLEYYVLEGLVKGELKYLSPLDPSNHIIPGVTQLIPTNQ
jgi:hypothetical protein